MSALTDYSPQWVRYSDNGGQVRISYVDQIDQAQGVMFLCPKCFAANGGPVGTHSVVCWSKSRGVPDGAQPKPGRWKLSGTGFEDLTLSADLPGKSDSVQVIGGCAWHGFVRSGQVTS